jgi:hypothetical protein
MKQKKYYLTDIESGVSYEVSKEHYDSYHRMIKSIWSKLNTKPIGQIIIIGTAGELDSKFEKMFKDYK